MKSSGTRVLEVTGIGISSGMILNIGYILGGE